jgi:hypothetical protein
LRAHRRAIAWLPLLAMLVASVPLAAATAGARAADAAKPAAETIVRRAFLPSPQRIHGELRLVERGDTLVLQTLLYSDALRRGVDRIRKKELYYWPAGRAGSEDSTRYLAGLDRAKRHVLERFASPAGMTDPKPRLLIEFVLAPARAEIGFYDVEIKRAAQGFDVQDRKPIEVLTASRDYLARAMRIQGDEGFDPPASQLAKLPR